MPPHVLEEVVLGKPAVRIKLAEDERRELEGLLRHHKTEQIQVRRAR